MSKASDRTAYRCRECGRGMQTSAWSRYAAHRLCRDCYRTRAGQWAGVLHELHGERPDPPAPPPDW